MDDDEEVIIAGTGLDVPADNYEEFDQEIIPARLGDKLVQIDNRKGIIRKYQFYATRHLLLNFIVKKNARSKYFRVDLAWLSAEPEHIKIIVWNWLYGAIAGGVISALCIYLAVADIIDNEYCIVIGALALSATLICSLIFIYLMRDEFVFRSRFGNAPLFLIENRKPTQPAFDSFFVALQQTIDSTQSRISVADRLVGELKMCRRLRDEGIIDDQTYTRARSAIFKHEQYKS